MKALIVDDEPGIRLVLQHFLQGKGYDTREAVDGAEALEAMGSYEPDLVFLDQVLPDADGEELIGPFSGEEGGACVVVMTAYADIERAVRCMEKGAEYFFQKPLDLEHVGVVLAKLEEKLRLRRDARAYRHLYDNTQAAATIVGESESIQEVRRLIALVAGNAATPVLITGESGTGKELVARAVHEDAHRSGPFVGVNCASLSEHLLESELFGHQKGSFTDAKQTKKGLFELADGGTIFLDELGEMPLGVQARLLRVLDTQTFRRVGGVQEINTTARVVAATNRDLPQAVAQGGFREDLYYRLSVFPIHMPTLRERPGDVELLARSFVHAAAQKAGQGDVTLTGEAAACLRAYSWPGNVRELLNVLERALILLRGRWLRPVHLPQEVREAYRQSPSAGRRHLPLRDAMADHVRRVVTDLDGNHSRAAKTLGISRTTLLAHLRRVDEGVGGTPETEVT